MIECRLARAMFRVHDDEFLRASPEVVAIPKAGVVLKPVRCDLRFIYAAFLPAEPASPLMGSGVDPGGRGCGCLRLIGPGDFRGLQMAVELGKNCSCQRSANQEQNSNSR